MTISEFSDNFDSLVRSYAIPQVDGIGHDIWGFDEYEKSMFLTQAEKQYVLSLYNGKNSSYDSFERTEEMRRYLHNLIAEYYTETPITRSNVKNYLDKDYYGISKHGSSFESTLFALPKDLWFITYESAMTVPGPTKADCEGRYSITQDVIPVTQDEFHRIKRNPFRGPSYRRALRLDLSDTSSSKGVVEIVSKYKIGAYYVRYIKNVEPIILVDLPEPLSIDGKSKISECQLHEALHRDILELAVRLAISSKSLNNQNNSKDKE